MFDLTRLRGSLIVSCQAPEGSPLRKPHLIAALAEAAAHGGAAALRVNGVADIDAIKQVTDLPIIGLIKRLDSDGDQWITPTIADAEALVDHGADVIAVDATRRRRSFDVTSEHLVDTIQNRLNVAVLADIDTIEAADSVRQAAAIATTLSGYTTASLHRGNDEPDIELLRELARTVDQPIIAEGRYNNPSDVAAAFEAGATAVVVGTAITDIVELTRRFIAATPRGRSS